MQTTGDIYIPMQNYDAMIPALRGLLTSLPALMGALDPDDIKIALGEIAGIWPVAILPDLNATMEAADIPTPAEVREVFTPDPAVPLVARR